jgi:hypothetical protein
VSKSARSLDCYVDADTFVGYWRVYDSGFYAVPTNSTIESSKAAKPTILSASKTLYVSGTCGLLESLCSSLKDSLTMLVLLSISLITTTSLLIQDHPYLLVGHCHSFFTLTSHWLKTPSIRKARCTIFWSYQSNCTD